MCRNKRIKCTELETLEWDILNLDIHHSKVPPTNLRYETRKKL